MYRCSVETAYIGREKHGARMGVARLSCADRTCKQAGLYLARFEADGRTVFAAVCLYSAAIGGAAEELERVAAKIPVMGGDYTMFDVPALKPADEEKIITVFRALRDKEYAEIVEECETKFVKEIEFEHFRQNYSFEEAEEIGQDLEKIRRWYDRIIARDWFEAAGRNAVAEWIARCQELLNDFEAEVYRRNGDDADSAAKDAPPLRAVAGVPRIVELRTTPQHPDKEETG